MWSSAVRMRGPRAFTCGANGFRERGPMVVPGAAAQFPLHTYSSRKPGKSGACVTSAWNIPRCLQPHKAIATARTARRATPLAWLGPDGAREHGRHAGAGRHGSGARVSVTESPARGCRACHPQRCAHACSPEVGIVRAHGARYEIPAPQVPSSPGTFRLRSGYFVPSRNSSGMSTRRRQARSEWSAPSNTRVMKLSPST